MAPRGRPVRSPRARALRAARAALRGRDDGRRRAPGSPRNELEPVFDVTDLPAARLDLAAEAIRFAEIVLGARSLAPLGERDEVGGRRGALAQRAEAEQAETPAQRRGPAARAPVVEERERLGSVEVVVEDGSQLLPLDLVGFGVDADEVVPERIRLRGRLLEHVVVEVDR